MSERTGWQGRPGPPHGHPCPQCGALRAPDNTPSCTCAQRASDALRDTRTAEAAAAEDFDPLRIRPYVELGGTAEPGALDGGSAGSSRTAAGEPGRGGGSGTASGELGRQDGSGTAGGSLGRGGGWGTADAGLGREGGSGTVSGSLGRGGGSGTASGELGR
ncbi:peptidoglycan-binding protein, partial [Streptomyces sp. NPDC005820]